MKRTFCKLKETSLFFILKSGEYRFLYGQSVIKIIDRISKIIPLINAVETYENLSENLLLNFENNILKTDMINTSTRFPSDTD